MLPHHHNREQDRFKYMKKIGSGSFGMIYKGVLNSTGEIVAIKRENPDLSPSQVHKEHSIYKILSKAEGFPEEKYYGQEGHHKILALSYLGKNLNELFDICGHKFSMKTVLTIADQMILRIEYLHRKGICHCDIKPENFLVGHGIYRWTIYLIDFGLSKFYIEKNGAHVPVQNNCPLVGTIRYASRNLHKGISSSRRDDLESIAYLLIYFLKGSLPWQGIQSHSAKGKINKIGLMKEELPLDKLCEGIPSAFKMFLQEVRRLDYDEEPNYSKYREFFRDLFIQQGEYYDCFFDWQVLFVEEKKKHEDNEKRRIGMNIGIPEVVPPNKNILSQRSNTDYRPKVAAFIPLPRKVAVAPLNKQRLTVIQIMSQHRRFSRDEGANKATSAKIATHYSSFSE